MLDRLRRPMPGAAAAAAATVPSGAPAQGWVGAAVAPISAQGTKAFSPPPGGTAEQNEGATGPAAAATAAATAAAASAALAIRAAAAAGVEVPPRPNEASLMPPPAALPVRARFGRGPAPGPAGAIGPVGPAAAS